MRRRTGAVSVKVKLGTSDANISRPTGTCPPRVRPRGLRLDHTDEEHIPLAEYLLAVDVLTEALPTSRSPWPGRRLERPR
ncbi:hypothetical protein [Streptomyces sp. KL116D]|uniref:hypothetical protein n=1 Tax=Streptomyces sp. KL116D TaxID=3045152 RepID=UPI0035576FC1